MMCQYLYLQLCSFELQNQPIMLIVMDKENMTRKNKFMLSMEEQIQYDLSIP